MKNNGFLSFKQFADKIDVPLWRVYGWKRHLPTEVVDGAMTVPATWAERFKSIWDRSCPPAEAAEEIGISRRGGSMNNLIKRKVVGTIRPFGKNGPRGQTRILRNSLEQARQYLDGAEERRRQRDARIAELEGHRYNSETGRKAAHKRHGTVLMPDSLREEVGPDSRITRNQLTMVGRGAPVPVATRRFMTIEEAARLLGRLPRGVETLVGLGRLRGERQGEKLVLESDSVHAFIISSRDV
jgi:hypothetical protein